MSTKGFPRPIFDIAKQSNAPDERLMPRQRRRSQLGLNHHRIPTDRVSYRARLPALESEIVKLRRNRAEIAMVPRLISRSADAADSRADIYESSAQTFRDTATKSKDGRGFKQAMDYEVQAAVVRAHASKLRASVPGLQAKIQGLDRQIEIKEQQIERIKKSA